MNEDRIKQLLRELGIGAVDRLTRMNYRSNDISGRQIHVLDQEVVVKSYDRSQFASFEVERFIAGLGLTNELMMPGLLGHSVDEDEACLVFEFAPGVVLDTIYPGLSLDEYCSMLSCLGEAMRSCHSVALPQVAALPELHGGSPNHRRPSAQRFERASETLRAAREAKLISSSDERRLREVLEGVSPRSFQSEPALCHSDIHNENVIYDLEGGSLVLIDWETAAVQPRELDFVHPYLNILGEGFPNRRLGGETGVAQRLASSFESGYGRPVDWSVVSGHAMLWYLEKALQTRERGPDSLTRFFSMTAVGAIEFAGALGAS